jgi:transposase
LGQGFLKMLREKQPEELEPWLAGCEQSGIGELENFAAWLRREQSYVQAAVVSHYSNGVAEGNVNRLKQIRGAMYGRGNFDLLRIRVLVAA